MNKLQIEQFNQMRNALIRISCYDTPEKLNENSEDLYGLDYESSLEMAYENIQTEAINGLVGINDFIT